MSEHHDNEQAAQLERVNANLTRSFRLCHSMIDDYRARLATTHEPANDDEAAVENEDDFLG